MNYLDFGGSKLVVVIFTSCGDFFNQQLDTKMLLTDRWMTFLSYPHRFAVEE